MVNAHVAFEIVSGLLQNVKSVVTANKKMVAKNLDCNSALKQAQDLGFAETDPTLDVQGFDKKYKSSILITYAFGIHMPPKQIVNPGINRLKPSDLEYALDKGLGIKLIAKAVNQMTKYSDLLFHNSSRKKNHFQILWMNSMR